MSVRRSPRRSGRGLIGALSAPPADPAMATPATPLGTPPAIPAAAATGNSPNDGTAPQGLNQNTTPASGVSFGQTPAPPAATAQSSSDGVRGGGDGGGEPDGEAEPGETPGERASDLIKNRPYKIDTRNIKVEPFDGSVDESAFDSNIREWWDEFQDQVEDAQTLSRQVWTDEEKLAVLKVHLKGMANRWFRRWRSSNPGATLEDAGSALVSAFKLQLPDAEIINMVYKERKRRSETYREYADRLLTMTAALDGGNDDVKNARLALNTFVRLAWEKFSSRLRGPGGIDVTSSHPIDEMERAVTELMSLANSDGRATSKPRVNEAGARKKETAVPNKTPKQTQGSAKQRGKAQKSGRKRPAEANVAAVERKKKPKTSANPSRAPKAKFACYICGDSGHTAQFHRDFISGHSQESDKGSASANQAVMQSDSSRDSDASHDSEDSGADE